MSILLIMAKKFDSWKRDYEYDVHKWMYVKKASVQERDEHPLAIIYVRVSTERQVTEWNWLKSQEDACRRWASQHNVSIVKVFSDDGVSWAITSRKWLNDAIRFLQEENKIDKNIHYFLCTEISRISRSESNMASDSLLHTIWDTWVKIYTTMWWEVVEWLKTDAELMVSKNYRLEVKERTINWLKSKIYAWEWVFPAPAWYEWIKRKDDSNRYVSVLVKKEPEASVIKEALELFANWAIVSQIWIRKYLQNSVIWKTCSWKELWHSYAQRLFNVIKLYFYTWQIIYPKYGIFSPIPAKHEPLISLSTLNQILERLNKKWPVRNWERKDLAVNFPLRWLLYCPYCWYPMTWWTSKWRYDSYDYYWCKRKDCPWRSNISLEEIHKQYKELLLSVKPSNEVIKTIDLVLNEIIRDKNQQLKYVDTENSKRIKEINQKIDELKSLLGKISNTVLIEKTEQEWAELMQEKENLERVSKNRSLSENEIAIVFDRVKTLLTNPIAVRNLWSLDLKRLQAVAFFWDKIYYKKSEGFQTTTFTSLYKALNAFSTNKILHGADYGIRTHDPLDHNQML